MSDLNFRKVRKNAKITLGQMAKKIGRITPGKEHLPTTVRIVRLIEKGRITPTVKTAEIYKQLENR